MVSLALVVLDHPLNNFAPVTPGAFSFKHPMKKERHILLCAIIVSLLAYLCLRWLL